MKLLIASDIHGDLAAAEAVVDKFLEHGCERLLLLGDLLYHGPRNDLPTSYDPKGVIALLNSYKDKILCVRGNCEAEVDQMVLEFPVMADYAWLSFDGLSIFATHGHRHNTKTPPPLSKGDILLHGHTHVLTAEPFGDGNTYLNPGSASLPKENNPKTYMLYENRTFTVMDFKDNIILKKEF